MMWKSSSSGLKICNLLVCLLITVFCAPSILAQGTAFTYQGRLTDGGTPANGSYDLQFTLWDALSGGIQQPQPSPVTLTLTGVSVTAGSFTVSLDFGANAFPGASRFLEIGVRAGGGAFSILTPRRQINSTPYAVRSLGSASADGLSSACVGCVQNSNINSVAGSKVNGAIPVASIPTGSANYIQNTASQQAGSNFNIDGSGIAGGTLSANIISANTQYNLGGQRVLTATFTGTNTFAGLNAGNANTGTANTLFGESAGRANTTGSSNAFFGSSSGLSNTNGQGNAFFGALSGSLNAGGSLNSFFGEGAGTNNTAGQGNAFFGYLTGVSNSTENNNTFLGYRSNGAAGITNATAIGANASVTQSNSLVLGSINGVNGAAADTKVGIGTTAPTDKLTVQTATGDYGLIHTDGTIAVGSFVGGVDGGGWYGTRSNHPLHFFVADVDAMTLTAAPNLGRVGIATTNPSNMLSVNGSADFSGNVGLGTTIPTACKLTLPCPRPTRARTT